MTGSFASIAPGVRMPQAKIGFDRRPSWTRPANACVNLRMSAVGLGRVKTVLKDVSPESQEPVGVSGRDRSYQRLGPDDVHDPCQIVGQDRKRHFGGYFWKRFRQEVCRPHPGLHGAEWVLDCLSTLAHRLWVCVKALLHSLEQMLVLPPCNPPLWPWRALGFERTALTGRGPVAPQHLAVFFVCVAIGQPLPGWTAIGVLRW